MENNNYGFSFDPNKVNDSVSENIEKKVADKNGGFTVSANSDGKQLGGSFGNTNYVIANHKAKTKIRKMSMGMGSNIGKGSNGFAGVATLATIIALAGIIIAFFALKY